MKTKQSGVSAELGRGLTCNKAAKTTLGGVSAELNRNLIKSKVAKSILKNSLLGVLFSILCVGISQADTFTMTCRAEGYNITKNGHNIHISPPFILTLVREDDRIISSPFSHNEERTNIKVVNNSYEITGRNNNGEKWFMTQQTAIDGIQEVPWAVTGELWYLLKEPFYDPYLDKTNTPNPKEYDQYNTRYVTVTGKYICTKWTPCKASGCSIS